MGLGQVGLGQVGLGQVGCREGWMQERTDAGKDRCRKGRMQERTNAGKEGYTKGGMQKGRSQDWRDTRKEGSGQERFWTGGIKDSWEEGQVGCRTRGIQDWMDAGKGDS